MVQSFFLAKRDDGAHLTVIKALQLCGKKGQKVVQSQFQVVQVPD